MRRTLCLTACLLTAFHAVGQNHTLDSLRLRLREPALDDRSRVDVLNEFSFHIIKSNPKESLAAAENARSISRTIQYPVGEIMARNNLAGYYLIKTKYEEALEHGLRAAQLSDSIHDKRLLSDTYSIIALTYHGQRDYAKAKVYFKRALALNDQPRDQRTQCRILNGMGSLARDERQYDSALLYYNAALQLMAQTGDEYRKADVLNNIGTVYLRQSQNSIALKYFEQSLDVAVKNGSLRSEIIALTNVGNVYIVNKDYAKGEEIEKLALDRAKKLDDKRLIIQANLGLGEIKMETGKHHEARLYMMEYYRLSDSLLNAEKNARIAELELKYESEKKNKEIATLENQNKLQKLNQVYLSVIILVSALVFAAIYYLQRSYNKKATALLRTQKQLNAKLKDADQLKSRFFAMISHEFRTPLSLILAPIESTLSSDNKNSITQKDLGVIQRSANRLLTLINQLLDLSKIEANRMDLLVRKGNLQEFISILTASFDSLAESRQITFSKSIPYLNSNLWYDDDKLEKIINNLLFNAFKFTPTGGKVTFSIAESSGSIHLQVTDTGKGISSEDKEHVFAPYYQSSVDDNSELGTGLGLSLVHELVKVHGGEVTLTSELNKGTSLAIILPATIEKLSAVSKVRYADTPKLPAKPLAISLDEPDEGTMEKDDDYSECVLVVEDNKDLNNYISSTLQKQFSIISASNGQDGFALAVERIPDLILSDVMMPGLTGVELTSKIKNDERTCHIPMILLTAKADQQSRMEGFRAGADDYLTKPFSVEELHLRVTNLIEQRKKVAAYYAVESTATIAPPRELTLDEKFLARVRHVVTENMGDSKFGVERMASEVHLSRAQLFRKLKAISGLSPNELINEMRLQRAAELISAKAETLAQISYLVGYNEQSYFSKKFRKKFGMTPTEYSVQQKTAS